MRYEIFISVLLETKTCNVTGLLRVWKVVPVYMYVLPSKMLFSAKPVLCRGMHWQTWQINSLYSFKPKLLELEEKIKTNCHVHASMILSAYIQSDQRVLKWKNFCGFIKNWCMKLQAHC